MPRLPERPARWEQELPGLLARLGLAALTRCGFRRLVLVLAAARGREARRGEGAELDVLAGADLSRLDLAVIEGSTWARYEGGATLETIAEYTAPHANANLSEARAA